MFNPTTLLIEAFVEQLQQEYWRTYTDLEPRYAGIIGWAARMALENIANSDALYHNVEHTVMVTLVGQEILKGKHIRDERVTPRDWLHFIISLLCHDIGYIRGVCRDDLPGLYIIGPDGETITPPPGATDAFLTPYHVDRGKFFIHERFDGHPVIEADIIVSNMERTRFPVPEDGDHQGIVDYPGLVRAADLIGQLADPHYLRKLTALFYEFEESGANVKFGYNTPSDLRNDYATFFWNVVSPYIQEGLRHLSVTQEGKQWTANLYANIFAVEHRDSPMLASL